VTTDHSVLSLSSNFHCTSVTFITPNVFFLLLSASLLTLSPHPFSTPYLISYFFIISFADENGDGLVSNWEFYKAIDPNRAGTAHLSHKYTLSSYAVPCPVLSYCDLLIMSQSSLTDIISLPFFFALSTFS
jgi:hypothetical protein